jgi:hemerythrin
MAVEWRDSLSVGIREIDDQHRELLVHFNQLLSACKAGEGLEELRRVLLFLDEYVIRHFTDEENLQRQHGYPGFEAHKKEHESFIARLKVLKQEIDCEGCALHHVMETNNLLLKWLLNHISAVDVQLGTYLKSLQLT